MLAGVLLWRHTGAAFEGVAALVGVSTLVVLVAPWCLGLMDCIADPARRRAHGGGVRLLISTLSGLALGSVLAPVLMLHHTRIVVSILTGHAVGWGVQQRRASGSFGQIVRAELPSTVLGIGVALWSAFDQAGLFLWLAPLWLPWSLAMPINFVVSSTRVGHWLRRWGLLSVPSELEPEDLLRRIDELAVLTRSDATARFRDLVLDPVLVTAHIARLGGERSRESPRRLAELRARVLSGGPSSLSTREWRSLAGDAESMQILHREAWQHWPVESWDLGREEPQVPPETSRPALAATVAPAPRSAPVALSARAASPASQRDG
jgi:membrane glycosyltransferase